MNNVEEKVLDIIEKRRPQLVSLTQSLIRERSVNPPGDETGVAAVLEKELSSYGMTVEECVAAPKRVNLISVLKGSENRHAFLFNGHMDTVSEGDHSKWTEEPFEGVVKGDLIFGRGAADMKGALAAITVGLGGLVHAGVTLHGDVIFHAVADEEVDSIYGTRFLVGKGLARADMGIVAEGSVNGNKITIRPAIRGNCWIRLKTYGKAAHASNPKHGINAVLKMSKLLLALHDLQFEADIHPVLPPATISPGTVIKGGASTNVIPDLCESEVDVRLTPGMTKEYVIGRFENVMKTIAASDPEFRATLEVFAYVPPAELTATSSVLSIAKKAAQVVVGYEPAFSGGFGTNDSVHLIHTARVPVIPGFGPADSELGNAHAPDENVSVSNLMSFAKIYALSVLYALGYEARR